MADIELVIKIPEEIYKASQIIDVKYEDVIQIPLEVIANGVPLPKGHGKIVDIDKLIHRKCNECGEINCSIPCYAVRRMLGTPTIIEADRSVKNGNDD